MMSNPKRTLLAGLLFGALVIGASVMRSGEDKLSGAQSGSGRNGASTAGELDNGPVETRRSNPASASGHSDDISHILQAIRDSLKRNDLASAKVLLGAVQTLNKDDSRAVSLQKELQAREEKADPVPPVSPPDNPRSTAQSTRTTTLSPVRAGRSHESAFPVREHATSTSHRSRITDARQIRTASNSAINTEATSPVLGTGRTDSGSPTAAPTVAQTVAPTIAQTVAPTMAPTVASTQARPALSPATPPTEQALPPAQRVAPKPPLVQSAQGPKTRAQVRAELDRARMDGSLPRFGNPDPAGPGGVPSSTKTDVDSE
jgi:hypothetical protein